MARHVHIALLAMLAFASLGLAQEEAAYHERLEFDPETSQWLEIAPPLPGTEAGDLALARSLLARGEFKKARAAFQTWFGMYPESPILPEAFFYAAETEVSADEARPRGGDLIRAYEWLEQLLDGWPGTELAERAMRKELIIAEMILFKHRKQRVWGGMLWLSAVEEALDMLARVEYEAVPGEPVRRVAVGDVGVVDLGRQLALLDQQGRDPQGGQGEAGTSGAGCDFAHERLRLAPNASRLGRKP